MSHAFHCSVAGYSTADVGLDAAYLNVSWPRSHIYLLLVFRKIDMMIDDYSFLIPIFRIAAAPIPLDRFTSVWAHRWIISPTPHSKC